MESPPGSCIESANFPLRYEGRPAAIRFISCWHKMIVKRKSSEDSARKGKIQLQFYAIIQQTAAEVAEEAA